MTLLTEGKSTIFFRAKFGDTLEISGKNFVIRDKDGKIRKKIPANATRDLVLLGDLILSQKVFSLAKKSEIPIHFCDGNGKFCGSVRFDFSQNIFLRAEQFRQHENDEKRLEIAKKIVSAKVRNQKTFLQKMRISGAVFDNFEKIEKAENLESLRGIEGSAAKEYFTFWRTQ